MLRCALAWGDARDGQVQELAISVLRVVLQVQAVVCCGCQLPACVPSVSPTPWLHPPHTPPLQSVLGEDLKASDIEVGLASTAEGGRFRVLTAEQLDAHLVAISERD